MGSNSKKSSTFAEYVFELMKNHPANSYTISDLEKYAPDYDLNPTAISAIVSHYWLNASERNPRWLNIHRTNGAGRIFIYQWKPHRRIPHTGPTRKVGANKVHTQPQPHSEFAIGSLAEVIGVINENKPEIMIRLENGALFCAFPLALRMVD